MHVFDGVEADAFGAVRPLTFLHLVVSVRLVLGRRLMVLACHRVPPGKVFTDALWVVHMAVEAHEVVRIRC